MLLYMTGNETQMQYYECHFWKCCYMCLGMKHTQVFLQICLISAYPEKILKIHRNEFRKYLLLFSSKPLTVSSDGTYTILKGMIYKTIFQFILHDCDTQPGTLKEVKKTVGVKK